MIKIASLLLILHTGASLLLCANEPESASKWITKEDQWSELKAGRVVLLESTLSPENAGKSHSATAALLVDATPDAVRAVVEDGDKAAGFQDSLVSSKIIEQKGSITLVKQVAKVGFHKVNYTVRQTAENPQLMNFELVEGDLKEMDGFWRFLPVESENGIQTLLIYRLSLEPNLPIPGFMVQKSIANNLPDTLIAVRDETARRERSS